MYKGIIFDLDGTLLDTITDMNNSVNDTYKHFNYQKQNSEKDTMSMLGHGMKNLLHKCFPDKNEEFVEEALKVFLDKYDQQYTVCTRPFDGISKLVNDLINLNIKVGVNSNKNHNYTRRLIEINFPNVDLNYVTGIKPGDKIKPDPTNVLSVIKEMKLERNEILYVGDSPTDIETAKNANLKSVGVSWGYRPKEKLIEKGADYIVDKPEEIMSIISKN